MRQLSTLGGKKTIQEIGIGQWCEETQDCLLNVCESKEHYS